MVVPSHPERDGLCLGRRRSTAVQSESGALCASPKLPEPLGAPISWGLCATRGTSDAPLGNCSGSPNAPQVPLRLPNDAQQRASSDRIVKWNGDGYCGCLQAPLHDLMAAALAHSRESVVFENATDLRAWKNSKLPNRNLNLNLGHEDLVVRAPGDFGRGRRLEEQRSPR